MLIDKLIDNIMRWYGNTVRIKKEVQNLKLTMQISGVSTQDQARRDVLHGKMKVEGS
jgi:hypothetical protein